MPSAKLTSAFVERACVELGKERTIWWDEGLPGFGLSVTKNGHRSYVVQYRAGRGRGGTDRRLTIGAGLTLDVARREAKKLLGQVAAGTDPLKVRRAEAARAAGTLRAITEDYFARECGMVRDAKGKAVFTEKRDADGKATAKLRSAPQRLKTFERLVYPALGSMPIDTVKRSTLTKLLDQIADERGAVMADRTLAYIRKVLNWHATRSDTYQCPIVKGMARNSGQARERILTDDELRTVWRAAGAAGTFGSLVKFILLTTARRDEAAKMRWHEIEGCDWTLPAGRNKTKLDLIRPLPKAAQDLLAAVPRFKGCPYAFSNDGVRAIGGYGKFKAALQKASVTARWSLHDLRRSSRSLMSRAGVPSDHAEHVMGHVLPGMKRIYDRHKYYDEKKLALEKLSSLIDRIVNPQDNVITLHDQQAVAL